MLSEVPVTQKKRDGRARRVKPKRGGARGEYSRTRSSAVLKKRKRWKRSVGGASNIQKQKSGKNLYH